LIISVLQNHSRSFCPVLSADFADYTLEKAEIRCFFPVLPNELASKSIINFNVMLN
jgi:hypothetical protein